MGSLSVSTHIRLVHWQGLLVAVSLFNFWCQPITAQLVIVSASATEGDNVVLQIRNKPPNMENLFWYKGISTAEKNLLGFLSNKPRLFLRGTAVERFVLNRDGSLLIKKVTKADEGMYTAVVKLQDSTKEIGFGRLNVHEPELLVSLVASGTTLIENKDSVVLTCTTNAPFIHWMFKGEDLELDERMSLSEDHQILTIKPVKREDAGIYGCEVSNPMRFTESWPVVLHVNSE